MKLIPVYVVQLCFFVCLGISAAKGIQRQISIAETNGIIQIVLTLSPKALSEIGI